ncbi:MAG: sigma-70 family RNA polymerase sigma factor [Phycisphaeraceae bacterium]|nr:sigma-70 family RNA polymerase sigma factor [Phycisphaeraceae bacterium]MBX3405255.1 sigma-70 family RNA polymerase sigma factor [Phycisphaeraceae bacterium]
MGQHDPSSGEALVQRAVEGDQEAMRALWSRHRRWVAAIVLAHMPREAELDDLLQDVATLVVSKIGGLRGGEASLRPWLRAIALSVARTRGRRTQVRKAGWLRLVHWAAGAGADEDRHSARSHSPLIEEGRRLMDLAAELPDGYREPLLLKCVQGMSYKEIGEAMGLPDTTIETRIARARRMLRERAEAAGIGAAETAGA